MDVDGTPSIAFDVSYAELRKFIHEALDAQEDLGANSSSTTNETLFTLATVAFERSTLQPLVLTNEDGAAPIFPLLSTPQKADNAMDEDKVSIPSQIFSHELLHREGWEYSLNLQTCTLSQGDMPSGIWLTQSVAMAISNIVGVSILGGLEIPVIVDEVHDPLGLGVNIEVSSTAGTVRYSWFDRLVCLAPYLIVNHLALTPCT